MAMARSQLAAQARRRHTFLLPILSDVLPLESLLVLHSSLLSLDRLRLHALYKQLQVWKCPRISGSFTQLPECSVMHFESLRPTDYCRLSLVRQTAHNMHVACIASCIHVTKNSNNALTTAGFTPCLAHAILTFGGFVTPVIIYSLSAPGV